MSQIFGNVKKKYSKFLNLSKYTYIVYELFLLLNNPLIMKMIKLIALILLVGFSYSAQAQLLDDLDTGKKRSRVVVEDNVKETVMTPVMEVYSSQGQLIATETTNNVTLIATLPQGMYSIIYRQGRQIIRTERVRIE